MPRPFASYAAVPLAALLVALTLAAPPAAAQPTRPPGGDAADAEKPAKPPAGGGWVNGSRTWGLLGPERVAGLSPSAERALEATANRAVDVIARSRVVAAPPDTICVGVQGSLHAAAEDDAPFPGQSFRFSVQLVIPGRRRGASVCGEGYTVALRANDPGWLVREAELRVAGGDAAVLRDPAGAVMYEGPNAVATVDGVERHYARGRRWVVLTKRERPPLLPVSAERYLTAWIAAIERFRAESRTTVANVSAPSSAETEAEIRAWRAEMRAGALKQAAELEKSGFGEQAAKLRASLDANLDLMEKAKRTAAEAQRGAVAEAPKQAAKNDAVYARLADDARRALAALSPAERAAPACTGTSGRKPTYLVPCSDPWSARVVTVNPGFMDRSLPPEAVQILVARTIQAQRREGAGLYEWRMRVLEELDYGALRALLR